MWKWHPGPLPLSGMQLLDVSFPFATETRGCVSVHRVVSLPLALDYVLWLLGKSHARKSSKKKNDGHCPNVTPSCEGFEELLPSGD